MRVTFDDISPGPSGRAAVLFTGGLDWEGAVVTTAAALPASLRPGVFSRPLAVSNALPATGARGKHGGASATGAGGGAIIFSVPRQGPGRFTPLSAVFARGRRPAGAARAGGDVIITCFDAAGRQIASGAATLPPGRASRVGFPSGCAGAARVMAAPAARGERFVMDDLVYVVP